MKRLYPLRLVYTLAALLSACPIICLLTHVCAPDMPYYTLILGLLPAAFIMPFLHFKRGLTWFAFRTAVTAVIVLLIPFSASTTILYKLMVAVLIFMIFTVMGCINRNHLHIAYAFCIAMLLLNLIVGLLVYNSPALKGSEYILTYSAPLSVFSVLTFLVALNMDESRRFGESRLPIPPATQRTAAAVIVSGGLLIAVVSFSPLIARLFQFIFGGLRMLISAFSGFIASLFTGEETVALPPPEPEPVEITSLPELLGEEPGGFDIPEWLITAIAIIAMTVFVGFLLFQCVKLLIKLFKHLMERINMNWNEDDVGYTEIVEAMERERLKNTRTRLPRLRYKGLKTERERVRFIYREYVKRAKRGTLTYDRPAETPKEILSEIGIKAEDAGFPPPEGLDDAYNAARYGGEETAVSGADEMKKRLL
ncbi:MAG: hypothetical protein LBI19_00250 [Oscillospiraceae bacterium]|jgi:hypothetical protein|nr:hypothetical protein [Oscillospiraceae bacterium]